MIDALERRPTVPSLVVAQVGCQRIRQAVEDRVPRPAKSAVDVAGGHCRLCSAGSGPRRLRPHHARQKKTQGPKSLGFFY